MPPPQSLLQESLLCLSISSFQTEELKVTLNIISLLNAELNPICHLLALLGAHHIFHVSGLMVNM